MGYRLHENVAMCSIGPVSLLTKPAVLDNYFCLLADLVLL